MFVSNKNNNNNKSSTDVICYFLRFRARHSVNVASLRDESINR